MLRVPTTVEPSLINGIGLYSARHIKQGELVWAYDEGLDRRITLAEYEALPKRSQSFFLKYGNFMGDRVTVSLDNTRFWNHSDNPNLVPGEDTRIVAARDIFPDEELTLDYRTTSDNPFRGFTPNQGQK